MYQLCFPDAKAQELPRLNRSSMPNLAMGTFIFCGAVESLLPPSSSDPGLSSQTVTKLLLVTEAKILPFVQKSAYPKTSLASMACQSVDSYRGHHKKQRTRAVMGACQPRLAALPATSGSWGLPLRSCRQRHFHIGLGQANSPRLDRLQPWPPSLGLALSFFPDSLTLTSVLACREPQCN